MDRNPKPWRTWGRSRASCQFGAWLAFALLGISGTARATNGYFSHGYGAKNESMAGAGIAFPQDAIAPATNPAGIAKVGNRLDFGIDYFMPRRGGAISDNFYGPDEKFDGSGRKQLMEKDFPIPAFGYAHTINEHWAWGFTAFGNGGMNTTYYKNPFARFGSHGIAGVDLIQFFLGPTLAYSLTEKQTVGVSINYVAQRFKAKGLDAFAGTNFPGPYSESPNHVSDKGFDLSTGVGGRIGWQGDFGPISMGATWQPKIHMQKFDKYRGLFAEQGGFDIPGSYGAGIAWHVAEPLTFAFDFQRIEYSDVPSVANPLSNFQNPNSLDAQLLGQLPPGFLDSVLQPLNPGQNLPLLLTTLQGTPLGPTLTQLYGAVSDQRYGNKLGSDNGPGFGWRDVDVYKFGANWQLNALITLRAGYSQNTQPIPRDQTFFNILAPGVVRDHYTAGATISMYPHEFTLNLLHAPEVTLKGRNSIPDAALPIPPASFGGGEADIRLEENTIGLSYAYRFD